MNTFEYVTKMINGEDATQEEKHKFEAVLNLESQSLDLNEKRIEYKDKNHYD
jgi:hypothetical protein